MKEHSGVTAVNGFNGKTTHVSKHGENRGLLLKRNDEIYQYRGWSWRIAGWYANRLTSAVRRWIFCYGNGKTAASTDEKLPIYVYPRRFPTVRWGVATLTLGIKRLILQSHSLRRATEDIPRRPARQENG